MPRLSVPTIAAVAVTVLGAALLLVGVLQATVLAASDTVVTKITGVADLPALVIRPQELDPNATQVRIAVTAPAGRPVFIGVGRVRDVDAYLAKAAHYDVSSLRDGTAVKGRQGTETTMTDPAGVDVWAARSRNTAAAELVWLRTPGQWAVLAATDGTSAGPSSVTMTWTSPAEGSSSATFIAIGLLLGVVGGVTLVLLWGRSRQGWGGAGDDDGSDALVPADSPYAARRSTGADAGASPEGTPAPQTSDPVWTPEAPAPFRAPQEAPAPFRAPVPWAPDGKKDQDEERDGA